MPVVVVLPCRVSSKMYSGLTRSADIVTYVSRTVILDVLSVRARTVRPAALRVKSAAYGILPQKNMCGVFEVLVEECGEN